MQQFPKVFLVCLFIAALMGCSRPIKSENNAASPSAATSPAASEEASPETSSSEAAAAPQSPAASGSPGLAVSYTDINGIFAEPAIRDEATFGVFGPANGEFKPNDTLSRGEFVEWLVTLNNQYFSDDATKQFRMPETAETTFVDVPQSNTYWKYVQALVDAGFVIGVDPTHFAPDRPITRQEMVAIKYQVDVGAKATPDPSQSASSLAQFVDKDQVSKLYITAIDRDLYDGGTANIQRIWGKTLYLHPTKAVTRGEAAVSLSDIAGRKASEVTPSPQPSASGA